MPNYDNSVGFRNFLMKWNIDTRINLMYVILFKSLGSISNFVETLGLLKTDNILLIFFN